MVNRHFTAWLRSACALFGIAGILLLSACGGGNGAPNNPYLPPPTPIPPLLLLPNTLTVYPGNPATIAVSGGVPPYRAFSTDQTVLPVATNVSGDTVVLAPNNVTQTTGVNITVQDSAGTVSAQTTVTVNPSPLLPSGITINGNPNPDCSNTENTVCSGGTGTASVKVTGPTGNGVSGRQVRFDVVQGPFQIVSTNPAQPLVQTLTVVTDTNGNAVVVLNDPADTPTQTGILRATDVTSGQQITGSFTLLQVTINGAVLSVLPLGTTTITGPDTQHCSTGVSVTNYIFGGTPPYTVGVNFPGAVTLTGLPVTTSGGAFTTTTNGTCFVNLTYVITDATGRTIPAGTYPLVTNQLGTTAPTPPVTTFVVTPGAISKVNCVPANTFQFIATGGTAPYSAVVTSSTSSTSVTLNPQNNIAAGAAVTVAGITSPADTTITVFDNSSPRQSATVQIGCTGGPAPPPPSALVVAPANYNFSTSTCVGQTANFVVSGGTAPYTVFFASPRPGATIAPTSIAASGQGFAVTGLTNGVLTTNITVQDSSSPQLQQIVTITCPNVPNPPGLAVAPGSYTYTQQPAPAPQNACSGAISNYVITGGTPPYNVTFSVPGTTGTINPAAVPISGGGFSVSGLAQNPLPRTTQIRIQDSSAVPLVVIATVICQ
ncbi:MAG TPA: hypothetical protein VMN56_19635 [Casimicrobiaceae bacterium]|nr:hypothetical protein [Casimicrobiaceae bacterium]